MKHALLVLTTLCLLQTSNAADPGARFLNLDAMIDQINLRPYFRSNLKAKKFLKVAVFDNGFRFAKDQFGKGLPDYTEIHQPKVPLEGEEEAHGFYMARIFWSLLTLGVTDLRYAPDEFHLYPTFGYSNLKAAVDDAIARHMDIILYSQTWEYGGNFDGRGFVNAEINRALDAGILWINNSGNFGQTTFNSPVQNGNDDWVKLPGANQSVEIRCEENKEKKCLLRTVLSWNSFGDSTETGTDKDLDYFLTDDTLNIIQASALKQKADFKEGEAGFSKYPREIITAELKPGLYYLRVKNRSKNFTAQDRLRITTNGDFIKMSQFDPNESILPPADNPRVISVGALDSERSSISKKLNKPELWTNSLVSISKDDNFKGTSNSAAMVAAGAAVLMTLDPTLTRESFLRQTRSRLSGGRDREGEGLPLEILGFFPTEQGCFRPIDDSPQGVPDYLRAFVLQGGRLVITSQGIKMFFDRDPIGLTPYRTRHQPNDIIGVGLQGPGIFPRQAQNQLPRDFIEVLETPRGQRICVNEPNNAPVVGSVFRLP